jgi:undecaprenyl phosphate N,N'-diacetylbacillosamine 1-phosphate transferase
MLYRKFFKRFLDFIVATFAFMLLLPVFLVLTIILFFANNGKPFFVQPRPGRNERIIRILKFKTMNDKKDADGKLLPDSERLTPVGIFVRKTSLDEIPQLINVILGDMSLIGPRPLLVRYLPFYTERERKRHQLRPGITGLAQVNGRNTLNWNDRLEYDVQYVENLSMALDVKIIFSTIVKTFKREDIIVDPNSIMADLDDSRKNKTQSLNAV